MFSPLWQGSDLRVPGPVFGSDRNRHKGQRIVTQTILQPRAQTIGWRPWRFRLRSLMLFTALVAVVTWAALLVQNNEQVWQAFMRQRWLSAAQAALAERRYDDAVEAYDRVEELDGLATLNTRLGRGYSNWQSGQFAKASNDLYAAYQMSNDLALLDAAAYLRYQSGNVRSAQMLYLMGSQRSKDQPELRHLSSSFVAYQLQRPEAAGFGPLRAIKLDLHLQVAYHLSAMQVVELHERRGFGESRAIHWTVDHLEEALAFGEMYPRLRLDAVRVYAMAVGFDAHDDYLRRELRYHAELAVAEGISPDQLTGTKVLRELHDRESWYADLVEKAARSNGKVDTRSFPIDLLARPTTREMLARIDSSTR